MRQKINRVMVQYHMAVAIEAWPTAIILVKQLIGVGCQSLGVLPEPRHAAVEPDAVPGKLRRASPKEWK